MPLLKLIAPHSLTHITNLLNSSVGTATFPANWKRAIIKPLAKTKAMTQSSDTRPIAQLPELSKVLERLVHNQLQGYLEANHLLHPCQAGFRHGHSTQTALLEVFDDIRHAIDKRMLSFLILFDFSKAFDSIPHAILLAKLRAVNLHTPFDGFSLILPIGFKLSLIQVAKSPIGLAPRLEYLREVSSARYFSPFTSMTSRQWCNSPRL